MNKIFIYEDEGYKDLLPLVYLRPVFDLYCGMFTFRERIQKLYPRAKICLLSRFDYPTIRPSDYPTLFINGRAVLHSPLPDEEGIFTTGDEIVGFQIPDSRFQIPDLKLPIKTEFLYSLRKKLKKIKVKATVIKYPWDLIKENEFTIIKDFDVVSQLEVAPTRSKKQDIQIGERTKVEQGVFLKGPIYIGNKVHIKPPSIIEGPCFIGDRTLIDGAKIRPGTTIGKGCRIGGEVEASIFSDYSNKHHEGFVGHSFIGEWVNLGAGTTTSDLKNTYGTIKVHSPQSTVHSPQSIIHSKQIDTRLLKLGSFIGDHAKIGIGTLLNAGCVIGCFANIYGGSMMPEYIPSFTWGTHEELTEYNFEKALEVAKKVMARRKVKLTKEDEQRIRSAFEITQDSSRSLP